MSLSGLVIKAISGFYTVDLDPNPAGLDQITAQLAGRLKQEWQQTSIVAVGDRVTLFENEDGTGTIDGIGDRKSVLSRTRPSPTGRRQSIDQEQVLVANLDQVIFVFAAKNPAPNLRKLDRFLIVAEMNNLNTIICLNKIDLDKKGKIRQKLQVYEEIGYPVIWTSVVENQGIEELRDYLMNKITVFSGSSGVGKSSLLNAIEPGLGLKVSDVSRATGKGMHTTRYAELFPLASGGYVADTPGIRGLALFDIEYTELDAYFREMAPLVQACQFSDCSHKHEPGCAIIEAVENGRISPQRYDSYLRLRDEHEQIDAASY
ncbi:MAG: ribosome small subunit-dependent GTPase A [Chloroflexota bacterium]